MSTTIGTVLIDVKADTAKLVSGMDKAQKSVTKSVEDIKKRILQIAAAYAGLEGIKAFKGMITDSINAADSTGKLAQKLGMTSDELSKLQYAAKYADVPMTKLTSGLEAMIRRTANFQRSGGGAAAKALEELGISADYANTHFTSTDATFKIIMERLSTMPDGFRKTAIAQDIFSKASADVIRLSDGGADELQRFGDEAQRFGEVVPAYVAKMSAIYNDTITHMESRAEGAKKLISYGILPSLLAFAETIDKWFVDSFGTGEDAVKNFAKIAEQSITGIIELVGFLKDSLTGIKTVLGILELGFLYMVKGITKAFNYADSLANSVIEKYNAMPDWMRGDKLELIGLRDISVVDKKIEETKNSIKDFVGSISNGRDAAKKFGEDFVKNLDNVKKMISKKYTAIKPTIGLTTDTSSKLTQNDYLKNLKKISPSVDELYKIQIDINRTLRDRNLIGKEYGDTQTALLTTANAYATALDTQKLDTEKLVSLKLEQQQIEKYIEEAQAQKLDHSKLDDALSKNLTAQAQARLTKEKDINTVLQARYDKGRADLVQNGTAFEGMKDAYDTYAKNIPTDFQTGTKLMVDGLQGVEDAFVNFVKTGKLSFKDLANSMIADLVRIQIKKALVGATSSMSGVFGGIGSGIMSLFGANGGMIPAKAYATGGLLTGGSGVRDDLYLGSASGNNIFAMGGEYILNKQATNAIGVSNLNHMNNTGSVPSGNVIINVENKSGTPIDMKQVSQVVNQNGDKTIQIVMNAIERNPDMRNAIKGVR